MIIEAPDESLWVGVLRLSLRIPGARSLKDKRQALARIKDRLRSRQKLVASEVGWLEEHTRSILAVPMAGSDPRVLRSQLDRLQHDIVSWGDALVEDSQVAVLRPWDGGATGGYDASHG